MSRTVRRLPIHRLAALGLLALAPAAHAAPLRSYTVAQLDATAHPGEGLDNDGHVVDQPVRTIVGEAPTFEGNFTLPVPGYYYPSPPTRVSAWGEVIDGTPDGRFLITTLGAGGSPNRQTYQTFVADPNRPEGWNTLILQSNQWISIKGTDVNASGEVIGRLGRLLENSQVSTWTDPTGFYAAAGDSTVHELIDLFPPGSGWSSVSALSINDSGQILGWGMNPDGEFAKFLLTPTTVPEPGTWAVFGLVAAALGLHARRRSG